MGDAAGAEGGGGAWPGRQVKPNRPMDGMDGGRPMLESICQMLRENDKHAVGACSYTLHNKALDDEDGVQLCEALVGNTVLDQLNLQGNSFGDATLQRLAFAMSTNTTIQKLDLSANEFEGPGLAALLSATQGSATLRDLRLNWSANAVSAQEGEDALPKFLLNNTSLTTLELSRCYIQDDLAAHLGSALKTNSTLTKLVLDKNLFSDFGIEAIAEGLKHNCTLTRLNMSQNMITLGPGGCFITEALRVNTSLTRLEMRQMDTSDLETQADVEEWVGLCGEDCQYFAEALRWNSTLKYLDISHNGTAGPDGGALLVEALKDNTSLEVLLVSDMQSDESMLHAVGEMLMVNTTLATLSLTEKKSMTDGGKGLTALAEGLRVNRTLAKLVINMHSSTPEALAGLRAIWEALRDYPRLVWQSPSASTDSRSPEMQQGFDLFGPMVDSESDTPQDMNLEEHDSGLARVVDPSEIDFLRSLFPSLKVPGSFSFSIDLGMKLVHCLHGLHLQKALAFLMVAHDRLGRDSAFAFIPASVIDIVLLQYFGRRNGGEVGSVLVRTLDRHCL